MGYPLTKSDHESHSVSLDVRDALAAAIERSVEVGSPAKSILDFVTKSDWKSMDERNENVLVFEPT